MLISMRFALLVFLIFSFKYFGQIPSYDWSISIGGASNDVIYNTITDNLGNVYNTGYFRNFADFDPGSSTTFLSSNGATDVFIQKLSTNGDLVWARSFGGNLTDEAKDVFVDNIGNVFITGEFNGTIDIDPGPGTNMLTSNGGSDIFIQKLDSNGNFVWGKSIGGQFNDLGTSIIVDTIGNIYVSGAFRDIVDFDPNVGSSSASSNGLRDIFLLKLNSDGNYIWSKSMGGLGHDEPKALISDISGIYFAGAYRGTVDFDPGIGVVNKTSNGDFDIFVQKLTHNGDYLWVNTYGGPGNDAAYELCFGFSNDIYVSGHFEDSVDFNPSIVTSNIISSNGLLDVFVQKLSKSNGNHIWTHGMGGAQDDSGLGIAVDFQGNPYFSGFFYGQFDADPSVAIFNLVSNGNEDAFVVKFNENGQLLWGANFGSGSDDWGGKMDLDNNGDLIFTGFFQGSVDFNLGTPSNIETSSGFIDGFCLKLKECYATYSNRTDTVCGSFTAPDGQIYTSSGTYTAIIPNVNGCDSVITMDLVIGNNSVNFIIENACSSYTAPDGQVYTSSGQYTAIIPNSNGCDSLIVITLFINDTYETLNISTCNNYAAPNGLVYSSSGTYTAIIPNANGCDSIITINLTITTSTTVTVLESSCGPYTAPDGQVYTSSGQYTAFLPNSSGCDSIINIFLTYNPIPTVDSISNYVFCESTISNLISFTGSDTSNFYTWSNDNAGIGLSSSGTGDINPFFTYNSINMPEYANIVVTPHIGFCSGEPDTFQIIINPSPVINPIADQILCEGDSTNDILFTGGEANCIYYWSNDDSNIGIPFNGTGDILSLIAENDLPYPVTSNFTAYASQSGCNSLPIVFSITVNSVDATITNNSPVLIANASNGAQYQWYNCDNDLPISGEVSQSFTAVQSGEYAVIVTQYGCVDTSWCYNINLLDLEDALYAESNYEVYPNPTTSSINIANYGSNNNFVKIILKDIHGKSIFLNNDFINDIYKLDIKGNPGIYFLQLENVNGRIFNYRIVKI